MDFSNRRSTPVSATKRFTFDIIETFEEENVNLGEWGTQFEELIDQRLYNDAALQSRKERAKIRRAKSSRVKSSDYYAEKIEEDQNSRRVSWMEWKQLDISITERTDAPPTVCEEPEEFDEIEDKPTQELTQEPLEEKQSEKVSEIAENIVETDTLAKAEAAESPSKPWQLEFKPLPKIERTYLPPRPPVNITELIDKYQSLLDEQATKRACLNELKVEARVLEQDISDHDLQEIILSRHYDNLITQATSLFHKLQSQNAICSLDQDNIAKLRKFYQLIKSAKPPSPHHVAFALDKIYGEKYEEAVLEVRTALQAALQKGMIVLKTQEQKVVGSISNLLGSYMELGSKQDLLKHTSKHDLTTARSSVNLGSIFDMGSTQSIHSARSSASNK